MLVGGKDSVVDMRAVDVLTLLSFAIVSNIGSELSSLLFY